MEVDFSIIVPVYNSERTILKCLESLQRQTMKSFEVLVIDDGSSDNSRILCDRIAEIDSRFKIIHQKNVGVSSARNTGLAMAKGCFIAFIDSDDTVESNYLEILKNEFVSSNADVVFLGYKMYSSTGAVVLENVPQIYEDIFALQISMLSNKGLFGYTWVKAFKNSVIKGHRFREDISLFEDEIFTCEVLAECHILSVVSFPIYHYMVGETGTLMGKTYQNYCELQDQVYFAWKALLRGSRHYGEILEEKANELAERCQYYLYERDIDMDLFLESASECTFIHECTLDTPFIRALKKKKWSAIKRMRHFYLLKIKIAKMIYG